MRRLVVAGSVIWVILSLSLPAECQDLHFEGKNIRLVLDRQGRCRQLAVLPEEKSLVLPRPFWRAKLAGKYYYSASAIAEADLVRVTFSGCDLKATYRIVPRDDYLVVELVAIEGPTPDEMTLCSLVSPITEHIGHVLNVRWDSQYAVCVMGLSDRVHMTNLSAVVYPEYGLIGEKAAIIAARTERFLDIVETIEQDNGLPHPTIGGVWAKRSPDVSRGYLFVDMTQRNVDEVIRYAKLGHFQYVMVYSSTWSSSLGSYPINLTNYPDGEKGLKATIDRCHAAGLKVGMHMLTSFVSKRDKLVTPVPDRRLLKDAVATLAADIDEKATSIPAIESLQEFPLEPAFYGAPKQGFDIQIDDEIIHYREIGGNNGQTFLGCIRGYLGTKPAPHKAGAKIYHLCQRYGSYLVDLRTSLKDEVADRVAGLINRCGFDMIYFDGGEVNSANGPSWYWVSQQQSAIWQRVQRDLLAQGSGLTGWLWHIMARGACDDYAAIAPKEYLDYHKIADSWRYYHDNFLPAELGWWGFLSHAPHHPATTPDEVEYYAVRMLALDTPVSLETTISALKANGRTEEMLGLLGRYERLRLSGRVPAAIRQMLRTGEWHLIEKQGRLGFAPIRYDKYRVETPGKIVITNPFDSQPIRFRLRAVPRLAPPGSSENIVLFEPEKPLLLRLPAKEDAMPGALAAKVWFDRPAGRHLVGIPEHIKIRTPRDQGVGPVNLLHHRALAVTVRVEHTGAVPETPPVLNVQLESTAERNRDHYVDLDFQGRRTIIIPEHTTERMLAEFRPAYRNYRFKAAMYGYDYSRILALNFRWMRVPQEDNFRCWIEKVEALCEHETQFEGLVMSCGKLTVELPVKLSTEDYVECWAEGVAKVYDRNGVLKQQVDVSPQWPQIAHGDNTLAVSWKKGQGPVQFVAILLDRPVFMP